MVLFCPILFSILEKQRGRKLMHLPLLSIIIPVFNAEETIGRAIKSVLNQPMINFELILINDGSSDNSLAEMNQFAANPRVRVITIKNSGVSYARNLGIEHSKGEYITFLDADDYYIENSLAEILTELDEHTQLMIFGYNINYENKKMISCLPGKSFRSTSKKEFRSYAVMLLQNEIMNAPWNKIYLSSYIKDNNFKFSLDLDIGEDLLFNLAVIKEAEIVNVCNKAIVQYSVKKNEGLVAKFRRNRFELRYSLILVMKQQLNEWGILRENEAIIDRMLVRDIMAYFMDFFKKNCEFSYKEKLEMIKEILGRREIKERLGKKHVPDLTTRLLELILRTNNSRFILLSAKILNIRRVMR